MGVNLGTVKLRKIQKKALAFIDSNPVPISIIDAPCGTGKSLLAMMLPGTKYILTTKKSLQDQYENDFGKYMKVLKGKANYIDKYAYKKAKIEAQDAETACLNFHSAYYQFVNGGSGWDKRDWLIIDEAHNLQSILQEMAAITIYVFHDHPEDCLVEIKDEDENLVGYNKLNTAEICPDLTNFAVRESAGDDGESEIVRAFIRYDTSTRPDWDGSKYFKVIPANRDHEEYTEYFDYPEDAVKHYDRRMDRGEIALNEKFNRLEILDKYEYVPIKVDEYLPTLLNKGKKVVIMSGTILNEEWYCEELGLDPDKVGFLSLESPFDAENRLCYFFNVGNVVYRNMDAVFPKLVEGCKAILNEHKDQRGIIHAVSYSLAKRLYNELSDAGYGSRLLYKETSDISKLMKLHEMRSDSVIVACGLEEGLDLKDDLGRFQIIAKMPYPPLGDPVTERMMEVYPNWYKYKAIKSLCQAMGRVTRSTKDKGITYVLDGKFSDFIWQMSDWEKACIFDTRGPMYPELYAKYHGIPIDDDEEDIRTPDGVDMSLLDKNTTQQEKDFWSTLE